MREMRYNTLMVALILAIALAPADIDAKIAAIMPTAEEEKWMTIPWRTDLNQARRDSVALRKPIFMWIMNGHPMGCT